MRQPEPFIAAPSAAPSWPIFSRLFALVLVLLGGGCELDLDSDTLVRELRVLALRIGDPVPGSVAEVQAEVKFQGLAPDLVFTAPQVTLGGLVVAPTGPGRRVAAPRPLQHDWFLCAGVRSLFAPGTLDPECRRFGPLRRPEDPDPMQNPALVYLGAGDADANLSVPTDRLKEIIGRFLQNALGAGGMGIPGGGMTGEAPMRPITLLLPVLLRSSVAGSDLNEPLNSEVAYTYLRIVIALPGMTLPPPNHNPVIDHVEGGGREPEKKDGVTETFPTLMSCPFGEPTSATGCVSFRLPRTREYAWLIPRPVPASIEKYTPLDDSGRMDVTETLRYAFFGTDGTFTEERTGDKTPQTRWDNGEDRPAPLEVSRVPVWVVAQDERGGADYRRYNLELTP